jgi:4-amino-4-deoxy-L-arabinose transferase-like glycosyltransferase
VAAPEAVPGEQAQSSGGLGGKSTRRLSPIGRSLALISGLWVSLLLGASVLWPMSLGYDEPAHVEMAYLYSLHPFHFYGPAQLPSTKATLAIKRMVPIEPSAERLADAPIAARDHRPTLAQLGAGTLVPGSIPDQMVQHPPLYYWLAALVLRVPGVSGLGWDLQIWLMRLLSVVLLAPVPVLCWASTRRLATAWGRLKGVTPEMVSRVAVLAAVVPLTVPNLIRDGSAVTNDSLLILVTSVVLYLLSRVLTGDVSRRTAVWIAISLAVALWTKGFSLVLPPLVLASYVLGAHRSTSRSWFRGFWRPLAITAIGGLVGGLWWLRNLIDYGTVQVNGFGAGYDRTMYGRPDNKGTLIRFVPEFITDFIGRIWGGVGIPDLPLPGPFIVYGWFFVVLIGVVAALFVRREPRGRLRLLVLVAAPVLSVLVVAEGSYSTFRHWSNGTHGTQGRYLYQTIVVIAALATIGWVEVLQPRARAALIPLTVVGAVATNAAVWVMLLRSWYQPATGLSALHGFTVAVHGLLRWSPLPSLVTLLLVGVLPTAFTVVTVVSVVRDAMRTSGAGVGDATWGGSGPCYPSGSDDVSAEPSARSDPLDAVVMGPAGGRLERGRIWAVSWLGGRPWDPVRRGDPGQAGP